ncbi:transcription antitermination factor NusB [Dethiosulfovibrio sp. F2B]|uniref:transcription antitermination factor NusB n=1 Tax=Dethiosulfovibrio faecalis TaxID=2720018 RepID=UPI001F43B444|nr:transcription antitermination factor NusB [Dethiosulfovibrio faecalis]MCF4150397.1 transcription antitermination factor NusB [Dethiosulfovibrio faecalis]
MKVGRGHYKKHRAREVALQLLYSMDVTKKHDAEKALNDFSFEDEIDIEEAVRALLLGVMDHLEEIDNLINVNVVGWRGDRMVAVDHAAIRLAVYEGLIARVVPVPVAISEAVELVKVFGTDESGRFVNGALARIFRAVPEDDE